MDRARRWLLVLFVLLAGVGLWIHARSYGFFADDAFITLRYGRMLWEHLSPVYNLGERVEGYTSPLWMVIAACAHVSSEPVVVMQVVGGVCAVLWLAGVARLWMLVESKQVWGGMVVLAAMALSCPVAAWTMGGLETPLFGALLTWSIVEAGCLVGKRRGVWRAAGVGVLLCLTTLARPEGALVAAVVLLVLLILRFNRAMWREPVLAGCVFAVGTGAHVLWRYWYYGYPFPNTFYLKSSGDGGQLVERGVAYALFAAREMGWPLIVLVGVGVLVPVLRVQARGEARSLVDPGLSSRRLVLWASKLLVLLFIPYVIRVGGDFLDLYRFFAPTLPLAFVLVVAALQLAVRRLNMPWQVMVGCGVVMLSLLSLHGYNQWNLRQRALQVAEETRAKHGIEPLGWTKLYTLRWAAMGRWVASLAEPHEWMAVGAAGAMPYHARISNLDTFGLCDEFVAHHGAIVASRPGHQRFAPNDYIVRRRPTFIFVGDYSRDTPVATLFDRGAFRQHGYRMVEAHVTTDAHGSPGDFYHYLYVREDRAKEFRGRPFFRGP